MKKMLGILLAFYVLVVPGAGAGEGGEAVSSAVTLADVNRDLEGQVVRVELAGGRRVKNAREVSIAADFTSWRARDGFRRVPTGEVVRITTPPKREILKGLGWGLGIGAAVGAFAVADSEDTGTALDPAADSSVLVGSVLVGGAVGAVVGAMRKREGVILYEAPLSRYEPVSEKIPY
jgi:hypothetical protein